ncbi:MAG: DUF3472 domain-containing protein [Verrucomicrobiaceae bacterium]|nr:MAG: DUF3472 domain-containing protein [Verrucomicrobiaceae bacterium]
MPVEGNAYLTEGPGGGGRGRSGRSGVMGDWKNAGSVYSVFLRVDRPVELDLGLKAAVPQGESRIRATVTGQAFETALKGAENAVFPLGKITVREPGYVRVDLQGISKTGDVFAEVEALTATPAGPDAASVVLDYVKDGKDNRFYWGRRGPSVHLGYSLPEGEPVEWFYNEITVPEGSDPIGSYFMSNGFGEGYFGMQVNSPEERRVLFSVWSPFTTDNPKEIPDDQKITLLKKGEGVHGGEFGGEGSGGQSYWNYPWKAGTAYKFLNRVHPDGKGSTVYSAWFHLPEQNTWKLIASFKRPKTDKHLTGAHSFLENFSDRLGYLGRQAFYGNQWACDVKGQWHEVTKARFTGDDIAQRQYRRDYAGGTDSTRFFLRNGGFFAESVPLGGRFTRESTSGRKPEIDFARLEGVGEGL